MSTRAQIAIFDSPTEIRSQYAHYDGGASMRKVLTTDYNSEELADSIVSNDGSIRYIDSDEISRFTDDKDREAELFQSGTTGELFYEFVDYSINDGGADYIHLWKDGKWYMFSTDGGVTATAERMKEEFGIEQEDENYDYDGEGEIDFDNLEEGYEAKWAQFLNESKDVDFNVIRDYIKYELKRGDEDDVALDAYIESLKRNFQADNARRAEYNDYEMDDYVEDFENYSLDKMDS